MPRLPAELLDAIIDESQNCKPALLRLSLVSKGCRARARLHLFRKLHLGNRRETDETLSCPSRQIQRLQSAHELLAANSILGWCVQSLTVTLTTFFLSNESESAHSEVEAEAFNRIFPQILGRLPRLARLCMGPDKSRLGVTDWNHLSADTQKAFIQCCISTNLKGLELKSMINVPLQVILSPGSSLQSLALWDVSLSSPDSGKRLQDMALRSIKELGWSGHLAEPLSVATSPLVFPFTRLKSLILIIKSEQDLHDLKALSESSCSQTLQALSLFIPFQHNLHLLLRHRSQRRLFFNVASALPQLRRLGLSLSLPSLPGQKYLIPLNVVQLLAGMIRNQKRLEFVVVKLDLSLKGPPDSRVTPGSQLFEGPAAWWGTIDSWLSSQRSSNGRHCSLRLKLYLHGQVDGPSQEAICIDLRGRLESELQGLLPETHRRRKLYVQLEYCAPASMVVERPVVPLSTSKE